MTPYHTACKAAAVSVSSAVVDAVGVWEWPMRPLYFIPGYHVYKDIWTALPGEILNCQNELKFLTARMSSEIYSILMQL